AYPLLHYYHTGNKTSATEVAIPVLDETLSIIEFGIASEAKPNSVLLKKCRNSIGDYLNTLEKTHIKAAEEPLKLPNIHYLETENVPIIKEERFKKEMEKIVDRRKKLLGLLIEDNWQEDVLFGNKESDD
ncbi:MAG: hypothetical protein L0K82_07750, partial [Pisciglobus halotolerans]|nr:hypothetical protein [Pisciglobus halotolerans]